MLYTNIKMKHLLCQVASYYDVSEHDIAKYRIYIKEQLVIDGYNIPIEGIDEEIRFELLQGI